MRRFKRLWRTIVKWWKDEDEKEPNLKLLKSARKFLVDYDDLYGRRIKITNHQLRDAALSIVTDEEHQRPPSLENEVRVLAVAVNQLVRHLEEKEDESHIRRLADQ